MIAYILPRPIWIISVSFLCFTLLTIFGDSPRVFSQAIIDPSPNTFHLTLNGELITEINVHSGRVLNQIYGVDGEVIGIVKILDGVNADGSINAGTLLFLELTPYSGINEYKFDGVVFDSQRFGNYGEFKTVTKNGDGRFLVELEVNQDKSVTIESLEVKPAGFTVGPPSVVIDKVGGTSEFEVSLDSEPTSDVVFSIKSGDPNKVRVLTEDLTFSVTDWNEVKTVRVRTGDGIEGDFNTNIDVSVDETKSDGAYAGLPVKRVSIAVEVGMPPTLSITTLGGPRDDAISKIYDLQLSILVKIDGVPLLTHLNNLENELEGNQEIDWSESILKIDSKTAGNLHTGYIDQSFYQSGLKQQDRYEADIAFPSDKALPFYHQLLFEYAGLETQADVRLHTNSYIVVDIDFDEQNSKTISKLKLIESSDQINTTIDNTWIDRIFDSRNLFILAMIAALILIVLLIRRFPNLLFPLGILLPSSRSDVQTVIEDVKNIQASIQRLEVNYQLQSSNQSISRPTQREPRDSSLESSVENDRRTIGQLQRQLSQVTTERDEARNQLNIREPELRKVRASLDEYEKNNRSLQYENENLNAINRQFRNEQETLLPRAINDREELSKRVRDLGGRLDDVVAELVAEYQISDPGLELNQHYWSVEDRLRLLREVLDQLQIQDEERIAQERERIQNSERINLNISRLESLKVTKGIDNIKALSNGAGVEASAALAAILDDMLASVPKQEISSEVISQIDQYSNHVDGLGINTRAIPRALIEICRELVANAPPEEVAYIETIIQKVIAASRTRF